MPPTTARALLPTSGAAANGDAVDGDANGDAVDVDGDGAGLSWVPCTVMDYNEQLNLYGVALHTGLTVSGEDGAEAGAGANGSPAEEFKVLWLPRVKVRRAGRGPGAG